MSLFSSPISKDRKQEKTPNHENKYKLIKNQKEFDELIKNLSRPKVDQPMAEKVIAFDVETDSLDMITGNLIGISFAWKENQAAYVPWEFVYPADCHSELVSESQKLRRSRNKFGMTQLLAKNDNYKKLKSILENPKIKKVGHNIKYDYSVLFRYGIEVQNLYFDTMIASYLINTQSRAHGLDQVAFMELGYETQSIEDLIGKGKDQKSLADVDLEKLAQYSSEDSDVAYRLYKSFEPKIKAEKLDELFYKIEMPLIKILSHMELNGIELDTKYLINLNKKVSQEIEGLKKKIYQLGKSEFNINSTQQLRKVLFDDLKISIKEIKKTKTGFSTAAAELEKLKGTHKIIDLICQYRELTKIKNTYLDALPKLVNLKTKRIHTSYNQTVTTSGRLSSSDPNLQNIPIRTDLGEKIRQAFVAKKGNKILALDYSQIELRVAAHFSNDEKMIKAFKNDQDIHLATAAIIFNKKTSEISKRERRIAKTVNFGILYGISAYGLAQQLQIKREEAQNLIDKYFKSFEKIKKYCQEIVESAKKESMVKTMFGHIRFLPEINSSQFNIKNTAERMAINHPIQGTAAEIMKLAMIKIEKAGLTDSKNCKMLLQVHDELVFEVKNDQVEKSALEIKKVMENIIKLVVPLKVDVEVGDDWRELKAMQI
jgi:DNA polymerase-1